MTPKVRPFFYLAAAVTCVCLSASIGHSFELNTKKKVFDNGLTALVTEMPGNPMVSVYALIKTGSANEGVYLGTGISHFIEHMAFKTTKNRGVGEIPEAIQAVGGTINASTSLDFTMFTINVPYDAFDTALEILSDMMINVVIDPKEFEKEQKVILREMNLHNDNPRRRQARLAFKTVYKVHPYRHPVIGYEDLFKGITVEDIEQYFRKHYASNNTIVSVAGQVDSDEIFPKIEKAFEGLSRQRDQRRLVPQEPEQISRRYAEEEFDTTTTLASMAWPSTSLLNSDLYAMDVLATILGEGNSSRLFKELYQDKKLVYSVSASNFTPIDQGAFEIDLNLEEENWDAVKEIIQKHIHSIKRKGVSIKELEKAKELAYRDFVMQNQTTSAVAWSQAMDEAFTGDYRFFQDYVDKIKQVTNEDIKRVASKYLKDQRLNEVLLKPKKDASEKSKEKEERKAVSIEKYVLDNGVTVLIREDPTVPLVSFRLALEGGARQESLALQGVSQAMAHSWKQGGTKRLSPEKFAAQLEGAGIILSTFAGRNSYGINADFLSEDMGEAWKMVTDLFYRPAFPEEVIALAKRNMKIGIQERDKNPFSYTSHALKQILFKEHPFRRDASGTEQSLETITREDVLRAYKEFLSPDNMVISVFGDIRKEDVLVQVRKNFSSLKKKSYAIQTFSEDPPSSLQEKLQTIEKEQAVVMYGFHGPDFYSPDRYAANVLANILGSSFSGRMFTNIREKLGKAYTLGGGLSPGLDAGMFYFYIMTTPEHVEKVKELMEGEFAQLRNEFVSDAELNTIKTYLKGRDKASQQTNQQLNSISSFDELYGLGYDFYEKYDDLINAVTKEDVKKMAEKYFDLNKGALVVTLPEHSEDSRQEGGDTDG